MSVEKWQSWMALLPCERCGWLPEDCLCAAGVTASTPPPAPVEESGPVLRVLTLDERRAAYASLSVPALDVLSAAAAEQTQGRGAA